jgi:tight adherence protein B
MDAVLFIAAAFAGLAGFYAVLALQNSLQGTRRLVRARTIDDHASTSQADVPTLRRRPSARALRWLSTSADHLELSLTRAGWPIKVSEYRALRFLLTAGFTLTGLVIGRSLFEPSWASLAAAAAAGLFGFLLLPWYVGMRQEKRLQQVEKQLPEVLSSMARSLRAGSGLLQALDYSAGQAAPPLGPELQRAIRDLHLGADYDVVFAELRRRVGSPDLDIATTAITIQRTVGGNLSEILSTVAATIRERQQIRAEIQVITARQKLLANLVALIPPFVAAAFFLLNPDVFSLALEQTVGQVSLAIGVLFEIAGLVIIRRLAVIEV